MTKDNNYYLGEGAYDCGRYKIIEFSDEEVEKKALYYDKNGFGFIDRNNEEVYKQMTEQGLVYKNFKAYKSKSKNIPCYVRELGFELYYYQDILNICDGNSRLADYVFEIIDWQSPEIFVDELISDYLQYPEFFDKDGNILNYEEYDETIWRLVEDDVLSVLYDTNLIVDLNKKGGKVSELIKYLKDDFYLEWADYMKVNIESYIDRLK